MTFDSESELHKCVTSDAKAQLLLRIRADDPSARCQLGDKVKIYLIDMGFLT
jgi:ornithine decarboxylase